MYLSGPCDFNTPLPLAAPISGLAFDEQWLPIRPNFDSVLDMEDYIRHSLLTHYNTLGEAFAAMDTDGDGCIDGGEFSNALRKTFGMDFLTRLEITALMSRFDTNGDGNIDFKLSALSQLLLVLLLSTYFNPPPLIGPGLPPIPADFCRFVQAPLLAQSKIVPK